MIINLKEIDQVDEIKFGKKIFDLKRLQKSNLTINETIIVSNDIFIDYKNNQRKNKSFSVINNLVNKYLSNSEFISIKTSLYKENIGVYDNYKCKNNEKALCSAIENIYESWFDDKSNAIRITHFLSEEHTFPALLIQNYFENINSLVTRCPKTGEITNSSNSDNVRNSFHKISDEFNKLFFEIEKVLTVPCHIYFTNLSNIAICSVKPELMTDHAYFYSMLDLFDNKHIDELTFLCNLKPNLITTLEGYEITNKNLVKVKGLPVSAGITQGRFVFPFTEIPNDMEDYILGCEEVNPEMIERMRFSKAVFTAGGGMTSHAALVCRGWGKPCVVGADNIKFDYLNQKISINDFVFKEFCYVYLNGTKGEVCFSNEPFEFKEKYRNKLTKDKIDNILYLTEKYCSNMDIFKNLSIEKQLNLAVLKNHLNKLNS